MLLTLVRRVPSLPCRFSAICSAPFESVWERLSETKVRAGGAAASLVAMA